MHLEYPITFQPSGRRVHVLAGTSLLEAAARAGVLLRSPCGGGGTCGKCRVRVVRGSVPPTPACARLFSPDEIAAGWRLGCQCEITGEATIAVPPESLLESEAQILVSDSGERIHGQPAVEKRYLELPEPDLAMPLADLERVGQAMPISEVDLATLASLPERLRASGFRGTAVTCEGRLLDWEPGHTEGSAWAVAFDLGTTTLVATLLNTADGSEAGVVAAMNPQIGVGDDVISRIAAARDSAANTLEMQAMLSRALQELIEQLCRGAGITSRQVYEVSIAGNTTMQHLICGISPAALGEIPFVPAFRAARRLAARDLGLRIHPAGRAFVFPNIGGFVGGDTVAGILANGVQHRTDTVLLVDIGTNGEIVLAHQGRLQATSCAAGPAFEGARIGAGMRAAEGAIDKVILADGDLVCNVIGGGRMAGICGTALIDAAALLLDLGAMDTTGRLLAPDEAPASVPADVRRRLVVEKDATRLVLGWPEETRSGETVFLSQRDLRELQVATAAIRAAIAILLREAGLEPTDLEAVLIAGGFGNFIRPENACRIGLLPALPIERIHFVGNASSLGAKAVLCSHELRAEADRIAARTEHVDLSLDADFQMEFGMAMLWP